MSLTSIPPAPPPEPPADRLSEILRLMDALEAATVRRRDADIECARALARLDELEAWKELGCASVGEFGERVALAADEARTLLDFGRAMKAAPYVETQVRGGRITVAAAALVGQALSSPALLRPDDDWVGWALSESTAAVRRRLWRRREEARMEGESPVPLTVLVRAKAREDFARARAVASRKASRALTPGETFESVVGHYLDTFDPDRVAPGARRVPHTCMVEGRYVPAAVRREVYERQAGRCAVPFCDNSIFVEMAHIVPHACGGHREADNLVLLCSLHHFYFDEGDLILRGTAAHPLFFDRAGNDLARRFDRPPRIGSQSAREPPGCEPPGCEPPGCEPPGCESPDCEPPGCEPPADDSCSEPGEVPDDPSPGSGPP